MKKIWTYGISNFDVIAQPVKTWPKRGELILTDKTEFMLGGTAINTALTLRKIGYEKVGLIARFGNDRAGSILIRELKEADIDTSLVTISDTNPTAVCIVCVHEDSERSFLYSFGGNNELSPDHVDTSKISIGDFFHLGAAMAIGESRGELIIPLLKSLKEKQVFISVDTSFDPYGDWWPSLSPCLPYTDVLFSNEIESTYLTGFEDPILAAKKFHEAGAKVIVIKLGHEGSFIYSKNWEGFINPFKVNTMDTTGAGDSFCGGFLFGLEKNWSLEQCGVFANAVGAICVETLGATTGIKSFEETKIFMKKYDFTNKWIW